MVAITVMLIVMAGIAAGATGGLTLARGNSNRVVAANIADEQIGEVRAMDFADIPQTVTTTNVTRGAATYVVTQSAEMVYLGADGSCESPSGPFNTNELSYLRVVVEVAWQRMDGIDPVRSETIIDPPVADFDPYRGHLAVKVTDRDGAPVRNMRVQLVDKEMPGDATPEYNNFETTDDQGCAFFGNLQVIPGDTVGNYHVRLNEPGWVDRASGLSDTSGQSPEPVVTVVSAQLRKIEFAYDRAAFLNTTVAGRFGGALADDPYPIFVANDNYNSGNGPKSFASPTALLAEALHPFPAGFSLWAGECASADPGPTNRARLVSDPGVTTDGTVLVGTADVRVRSYFGLSSAGGSIIEARNNESGCSTPPLVFSGAPADGGGRTTIALPYGSWTLRVGNRTTGTSTVVLSVTDGAAVPVTVYIL